MQELIMGLEEALILQKSEFCKETILLQILEENRKIEEELALLFN